MYLLNISLLVIDSLAIIALLLVCFFMSKSYHSWRVPRINTYNDVINSSDIEKMMIEFKSMFNLKEYEIIYAETDFFIKIFKNLNKRKKQIVISKRIFESVGYELDYLISRIWLSAKISQKDTKVAIFRATLTYVPLVLLLLIFAMYLIQTVIFFAGINFEKQTADGEVLNMFEKIIFFLWKKAIFGFLTIAFVGILFINYYFSMKFKEIIETEYNSEITGLVKVTMESYFNDFVAARTYSQDIKLSFIPIFKPANFWDDNKWMGPFVYM